SDRGRPRFADPCWRFRRWHDMHFDFRHLVDAQHLVVVEVGLHYLAVFERDLAHEQRRQSVADAALHLRDDDVGIHDETAVDGTDDAFDPEAAVVLEGYLCDFGDERVEGFMHGDAPRASRRQ